MSVPSMRISPRSGLMSPAMRRSKTLLPEPLPPMMVRISPFMTDRSMPRSTSWPSNATCTAWSSITGGIPQNIRKSLVKKKSAIRTLIAPATTVAVVNWPISSVPRLTLRPL